MKYSTYIFTILAAFLIPGTNSAEAANITPSFATKKSDKSIPHFKISNNSSLRTAQLNEIRKRLVANRTHGASLKLNKQAQISTTNSMCNDTGEVDDISECGGSDSDRLVVEAFYEFNDIFSPGQAHEVYEKVEVSGSSGCFIEISSSWGTATARCDELQELQHQNEFQGLATNVGLDAILDVSSDIIQAASPILDKCIHTTIVNLIKTPDQDKEHDYLIARDAIELAYAGNSSALRFGVRADVTYPSGHTVRFFIATMNGNRIGTLTRFLDGIPDPKNSPCK